MSGPRDIEREITGFLRNNPLIRDQVEIRRITEELHPGDPEGLNGEEEFDIHDTEQGPLD